MKPNIRFNGFEDEWIERKLGEIVAFFDEKRHPITSGERISGKYPYYGATGIIDYVDGYIFDGEYVLLAEDGANIITRNSPISYLASGKFWLNNHAHIMKMINGSNFFLSQSLENRDYERFNSGTAQPKLNGSVVRSLHLNIPGIAEQQKISVFFEKLEAEIAAEQTKIDWLKEQKKGLLEKAL